ncbi:MAG: DUF3551 domain-containing protein [Alphaproteobacteria bacterium]|nr:DUF3551 domain-containing protein [Alphaproteobacteria bacterium]
MKYIFAVLITLLTTLSSSVATAAPFCLKIQGIAEECTYFDATQCRQRATKLKALCIANMKEVYRVTGDGRYCRVDSLHTALCLYADRRSCESEASKAGGTCIDKAPVNLAQENPYRYDPNKNY